MTLASDPTLWGWSLAVCYGLSALACAGNAARCAGATRGFWALLTGLLLLMAVNKQADLHQVLRDVVRPLAQTWGWYDSRRVIQAVAFVWALGAMLMAGIALAWWLRDRRDLWWAWAGALAVAWFVLLRMATFYHVADVWLKTSWMMGFSMVFEWVGPVLILSGALRWARGYAVAKHLPSRSGLGNPGQGCGR